MKIKMCSGFTLIELMNVIVILGILGILGILASIALPTINKSSNEKHNIDRHMTCVSGFQFYKDKQIIGTNGGGVPCSNEIVSVPNSPVGIK